MNEQLVVPKKGVHVYDISYFDEAGEQIGDSEAKELWALEPGSERELQFMDRAIRHGAHSYSVRVLRPGEVRQMAREHKKAEARQKRKDLFDNMPREILRFYGLDIETILLPASIRARDQYNTENRG